MKFLRRKNCEKPIHQRLFLTRSITFVRKAFAEEQTSYRNWALNPHDQKDVANVYPHAYANVETRNDATFC